MHLDVLRFEYLLIFFSPFRISLLFTSSSVPFPSVTATYPFLPVLEALRFLEWIPRFSHLNLPYSSSRYVREHSPRYECRCALGRISPEEARGWWQLVRLQASSMSSSSSLSSWNCCGNHFRLCAFRFYERFVTLVTCLPHERDRGLVKILWWSVASLLSTVLSSPLPIGRRTMQKRMRFTPKRKHDVQRDITLRKKIPLLKKVM